MQAGRLTQRITIEQPTEAQSASSGAIVPTWSTLVQRWAALVPRGGREFVQAEARHTELTDVIRMRGYCLVTEKMRVKFGTRTLEILAAYGYDGRSCDKAAEVVLVCKEIL